MAKQSIVRALTLASRGTLAGSQDSQGQGVQG
jgi:hypothetical protein